MTDFTWYQNLRLHTDEWPDEGSMTNLQGSGRGHCIKVQLYPYIIWPLKLHALQVTYTWQLLCNRNVVYQISSKFKRGLKKCNSSLLLWSSELWHCTALHNNLQKYSSGLNFTLSSMKTGEAHSYKSLCTTERLCVRNTFNRHQPNFCLQCKSNDVVWCGHMVYSSEVYTVGSFPSWLQPNTHACTRAHTRIHTHLHTYIQPIQLCM